jgi:hypothetical protein
MKCMETLADVFAQRNGKGMVDFSLNKAFFVNREQG